MKPDCCPSTLGGLSGQGPHVPIGTGESCPAWVTTPESSGDNTHNLKPVTVTTYDSACIHMQKLGDLFGLIIFDECHHLPGDLRREAALMSAAPMRLGLTATLERADGRHADLMKLIGSLAYEMPLSLARGKTLAEYETVRIPVPPE